MESLPLPPCQVPTQLPLEEFNADTPSASNVKMYSARNCICFKQLGENYLVTFSCCKVFVARIRLRHQETVEIVIIIILSLNAVKM